MFVVVVKERPTFVAQLQHESRLGVRTYSTGDQLHRLVVVRLLVSCTMRVVGKRVSAAGRCVSEYLKESELEFLLPPALT